MNIIITLDNGEVKTYKPGTYDEYKYDGACFIVIKDTRWIGIYNINHVRCVEIIS